MINYFCLLYYCYFNIGLFFQPIISDSLNHKHLKKLPFLLLITEKNENNINRSYFIPGLWRGFHEFEEFTVYYAYQFSRDNSFWARHRIYQNNQTIEDINWQGKWQFSDNILELKGVNLKDKDQQYTINFKLKDIFQLVYETGSFSDSYQMMILNKIGQ
ncbi:MAG: hypothetical protein AB4062_15435 [Crocosphaera sp.]